MFEKLAALKARYLELTDRLADPAVIAKQDEWQKVAKEHSSLEEIVAKYDEYLAAEKSLKECEEILAGETDPDLVALAEEEKVAAEGKMASLKDALKILLLPKDPNDDKNVVIEIRAGTGGEEASLFGAVLMRM